MRSDLGKCHTLGHRKNTMECITVFKLPISLVKNQEDVRWYFELMPVKNWLPESFQKFINLNSNSITVTVPLLQDGTIFSRTICHADFGHHLTSSFSSSMVGSVTKDAHRLKTETIFEGFRSACICYTITKKKKILEETAQRLLSYDKKKLRVNQKIKEITFGVTLFKILYKVLDHCR